MEELRDYIRSFLADPDKSRWSDKTILYLMNAAQLDLAHKANLLMGNHVLKLSNGRHLYDLPKDIIKVTRVSYMDCVLPIVSYDKLDSNNCKGCWEHDTGTPKFAIKEGTGRSHIRIYPTPDFIENDHLVDLDGLYTELPAGNKGVAANKGPFTSVDGTITDILSQEDIVNIQYVRKPVKNKIELDEVCYQAIKYYVCGHLLRDDKDSNSRELGREELQLYTIEMSQLKKDYSLAFNTGDNLNIEYRKGI